MTIRDSAERPGPGLDAYDVVLQAPFGGLGVVCDDDAVVGVDFLAGTPAPRFGRTAVARRAEQDLHAYLEDPERPFRVPVRLRGTPFQRRVWQALREIPTGECRSYGRLAAELRSAARAVGGACRRNPVAVIVPCHRVVAAHGMGGFSGATTGGMLEVKRWLLEHEGAPGTA